MEVSYMSLSQNTLLLGSITAITVVSLTLYLSMGGFFSKRKETQKGDKNAKKDEKSKKHLDEASKFPAGNLTIYFGSQTGTAEGFARQLMTEGKAKGFNAKTADLEEFDADKLSETSIAIFLMATYGEGEPTDNAQTFYKWLKNPDGDVNDDFLSKLKYTVFGLGNRQYEQFNAMGKAVDKLLAKLGAARACEYGEGDDDGSLEEDFETWKAKLWPSLLQQFHPLHKSGSTNTDEEVPAKVDLQYDIKFLDKVASSRLNSSRLIASQHASKALASTRFYFTSVESKVVANRELRGINDSTGHTEDSIGSTRHIELDVAASGLTYLTADNAAILPQNNGEAVAQLAKAQGYELYAFFEVVAINSDEDKSDLRFPFPSPCTVSEALTCYVDIHGSPKHSTLTYLLPYVEDPAQKQWLIKLLSKEERKHFVDVIEGNGISLYSLLIGELSSCRLPLVDLLHIAPSMQPRYYTISSSSSVHPKTIHVTVSVTNTPVKSGKIVPGLCSTYLRRLDVGLTCRIFVRASSFRLPEALSTPIIMIGPGTGIAPMRALLQERAFRRSQALENGDKASAQAMTNVLYFGCRRRDEDFLYSDELAAFQSSGVLTKLQLAFSREGAEKVYVQHLLKQADNASALIRDLDAGAHVYVCGATAMGEDVMKAVLEVLSTHKGLTHVAAESYVKALQVSGRYVQELWTA